jgi:SAM-dependent methyltransferase
MSHAGRGFSDQDRERLLRIGDRVEFIRACYRAILGRQPDPSGARRFLWHWLLRPFGARQRILRALLASSEYREAQQHYHRERHRALEQQLELSRQHAAAQQRQLALVQQEAARQRQQLVACERQGEELARALARQRLGMEQERQAIEREREAIAGERRSLRQQSEEYAAKAQQLEQQNGERIRHAAEAWQILRRYEARAVDEATRRGALETLLVSNHADLLEIKDREQFTQEAYRVLLGRTPSDEERTRALQRLEWRTEQGQREVLGAVLAERAAGCPAPGAPPGLPAVSGGPAKEPGCCRLCGGELAYRWTCPVLEDRYSADYYECLACQALQVPRPFWLDEAHRSEHLPRASNPDAGRFARNFFAYTCFVALVRAGMVAPGAPLLDFGGGYGLLAQMLRSGGFQAWQYDPHVATPFLASAWALPDLAGVPPSSFDVVFALEVAEHLTEPHAVLAELTRVLKPEGTLLLSTGIYEPGVHDSRWPYLATAWGQHVTFWSRRALLTTAARFGFRSVGFFPGQEGFFILFSRLPEEVLLARLQRAAALLSEEQFPGSATSAWLRASPPYPPTGLLVQVQPATTAYSPPATG